MSAFEGTEWEVVSVVKISDGDTLRMVRSRVADIDGRHYRITDADLEGIAIRLVWVNTPEKGHHPGWENARADLTEWVGTHSPLRVICYESGGWDRILGDLIDADGNSASQWLMTVKNWPPYVGSKA